MKLLVAIPHFFKAGADPRYGSSQQEATVRARKLLKTLLQLHQHFGPTQSLIDIANKKAHYLNRDHVLQIVICVHGDDHLLDHFSQHRALFRAVKIDGNPKHLGFACHKVLGDQPGFDRYLYLEDDLLIHDPGYFEKLDHLENSVGTWALLQPHRFERGPHPTSRKCYVDGPLRQDLINGFHDPQHPDNLQVDWGYTQVHLERARNPHSGTFSLSKEQWRLWTQNPQFLDRDTSFIGPLESAASLSMMKTFEVYKTRPDQARHLEIEHQGRAFISQVTHGKIPMEENISLSRESES